MSIIYDALKKVNHNNKTPHANPRRKKSKKKQHKPRRLFIIFLIIAIFIFLTAAVIFFSYFPRPRSAKFLAKPAQIRVDSEPKKEAPTTAAPPSGKYKENQYLLEGIISDSNTPLAVINGQVLAVGDKFANIKILEINKKSVKILNLETQKESNLTFD